jgi:hypothetical protein
MFGYIDAGGRTKCASVARESNDVAQFEYPVAVLAEEIMLRSHKM